MLTQLLDLDQSVFLFFNGLHSPFWDRAMFMFSGRFIWVPMYAAFLIAFFKGFNWSIALVWTIAVVLTITLADQICATYIRPYFMRLRPSNLENPMSELVHIVSNYRGGRYGFPSCHAANSFGLATIMALIWRGTRLKWFIFLWAFVNSYSRIYLGVHYPGDLIVGGIIGSLIAIVVWCVFRLIVRQLVHGEMKRARPKQYFLTVNGRTIAYRSIDGSVVIGLAIIIAIMLLALD